MSRLRVLKLLSLLIIGLQAAPVQPHRRHLKGYVLRESLHISDQKLQSQLHSDRLGQHTGRMLAQTEALEVMQIQKEHGSMHSECV